MVLRALLVLTAWLLSFLLPLSPALGGGQGEQAAPAGRAGWGHLELKVRAYYLHRDFERAGLQESLALGAWAVYTSPEWHGLSFGLGGYTSQPFLVDDPRHDGGGLLAAGQSGYSVLGQAWLQARLGDTSLRLGRLELDSPFINPFDVKMVPVTFEGALLTDHSLPGLRLTAAHLIGIKPWTDTTFQPFSRAAGVGGEEPVSLVGGVWRPAKGYTLQLWDYFCHQFMNVAFFQADASFSLSRETTLLASAQAIDQRDVGRALGGTFNAGQWGLQAKLLWRGWGFTAAFTSTRPDHDIVNPWGSYPVYTSIMEEDNDRAGEDTWLAGLSYDFAWLGAKGLSAYTLHTFSRTPDSGTHASPDQTEHDLTVDYRFAGALEGLWLRVRGAYVDQDESLGGEDFSDFRIIINYDFSLGG